MNRSFASFFDLKARAEEEAAAKAKAAEEAAEKTKAEEQNNENQKAEEDSEELDPLAWLCSVNAAESDALVTLHDADSSPKQVTEEDTNVVDTRTSTEDDNASKTDDNTLTSSGESTHANALDTTKKETSTSASQFLTLTTYSKTELDEVKFPNFWRSPEESIDEVRQRWQEQRGWMNADILKKSKTAIQGTRKRVKIGE
jgi:hypothetical protein